jgi:hypothetical protein
MSHLRYIPLWFWVATILIAAGFAFSWLTVRAFHAQVRQTLREQKAAGKLPAELQDIDPETWDSSKIDFQMKLPRGMETRLQIVFWLTDLWFVWVPLVFILCFIAAMLMGGRGQALQ